MSNVIYTLFSRNLVDLTPPEREQYFVRRVTSPRHFVPNWNRFLRFDQIDGDTQAGGKWLWLRKISIALPQPSRRTAAAGRTASTTSLDTAVWVRSIWPTAMMAKSSSAWQSNSSVSGETYPPCESASAGSDRFSLPSPTRALHVFSTLAIRGGQPYLVMEYVEGTPIDIYVENLDLRAILGIFLGICEAVSYGPSQPRGATGT